ncbi:hypothetical protein HY972_03230 [Candidatus Kaiserbacteria bacterium]|nr:hypothetical protein [Candidatus Kaiserbacteria bacterium]
MEPKLNTINKRSAEMEDIKINVKFKISALWIAMLFVFAYVDIFAFYRPGIIEGIMAGKVAAFQIDQVFLFLTTLYITIPSIMVFLSLVLKPVINRWANIIVGILYIVSILLSLIGEVWFFIFGSIVESLLLSLIVWYAWKWPKREDYL